MPERKKEIIIQGTPASPGIAFAPVHCVARGFSAPEVYEIEDQHVATEQQRFERALELTKIQIDELQTKIEQLSGEGEGKIFEAHLMTLEDNTLLSRVKDAIANRKQNAEYAFYAVMQNFLEAMRRINDPYLKERASDVDDICQRVLRNFEEETEENSDRPDHSHIIVAYDLNPSDTATMDRKKVLGFATEQGSINSHTAILSRSLGIPSIVGLNRAMMEVETLSFCILDGYSGKLILNPEPETISIYRERQLQKLKLQNELESLRDRETTTIDGREITLAANIEFINELPQVQKSGAKGIGLYRTEFYLLNGGELPDSEQQARVYTGVAKAMRPHQTIIRTLDAGGDKLSAEPLTHNEPNPFLGWRGIRVSLARKAMFKEQIRAILKASTAGKIGMMFPMVSGLREVQSAKKIIDECMLELDKEGIDFDEDIDIGVMIEIPSAALMANEIAKEVDFFSIGTNDLIQYTVAVDRVNPYVADLYKPTHPAVIRLIKMTVDAAYNHGIWTGVCGEMAADLDLTPLLIGLGIEELSVGSHQLPSIKQAVRSLSHAECSAMADEALRASSSPEILSLSKDLAMKSYPRLFE
ncbi:phosphoenolpyruvate--protein phosphotransferase [Persicirhabdus sediminis]|uniref:Phosphoenolpyruvate-protein phosphotransferase n=1 Tax=Persicirhabdus sediminis TaxID=454144 RepID=A0A8J7SHE5_9BACT|nr:phosphoenolpyruvate--protein phosphotransferase [Persicirhabdus sediminis]MBK1790740.1 phosphoenolpyruvate--protein phosphotransferase [Persicirhabdus sediminis]